MDKQEFLEKLRLALSGKVAPGVVSENLTYYENYINTELRKGKSEREVLDALGDPRLIARTIVETSGRAASAEGSGFSEGGAYQGTGTYGDGREGWTSGNKMFRVSGWMVLLLVLIVVVVVLGLVFSVLRYLMPVLLPILAVAFLVKLFRDWMG